MGDEVVDSADWVGPYEAGLASYRERDFATAISNFENTQKVRKHDQASTMMIERCKRQLEGATGEAWDDTMIAQTK